MLAPCVRIVAARFRRTLGPLPMRGVGAVSVENQTNGFRSRMVQRMSGPSATSASALSKECGISQGRAAHASKSHVHAAILITAACATEGIVRDQLVIHLSAQFPTELAFHLSANPRQVACKQRPESFGVARMQAAQQVKGLTQLGGGQAVRIGCPGRWLGNPRSPVPVLDEPTGASGRKVTLQQLSNAGSAASLLVLLRPAPRATRPRAAR